MSTPVEQYLQSMPEHHVREILREMHVQRTQGWGAAPMLSAYGQGLVRRFSVPSHDAREVVKQFVLWHAALLWAGFEADPVQADAPQADLARVDQAQAA